MSTKEQDVGLAVEKFLLEEAGDILCELFPEVYDVNYIAAFDRDHEADAFVKIEGVTTLLDVKTTSWPMMAFCRQKQNESWLPTILITKKCYDKMSKYPKSVLCQYFIPDNLIMLLDISTLVPFETKTESSGAILQRLGIQGTSIISAKSFNYEKSVQRTN